MDRPWWPVVARVARFAVLVAAGIVLAYVGAREAAARLVWMVIPR